MLGVGFSISEVAGRGSGTASVVRDFTGSSLPAGVTLSRASEATRVGPSGLVESLGSDVARLDHDPITLAARGLLVEAAATNLLLHNSAFEDAAWTRSAANPSGTSVTGPDGASCPGWSFSNAYVYQDVATTSEQTYTTSVWIRANMSATIGFRNLQASSTANVSIGVTTQWQRIAISGLADGASSRFLLDNRGSTGYGASGLILYLWGAQIEAGGTATSLIQTTSAPRTRAADLPGLAARAGPQDVTVTYDDGSTTVLTGQTVDAGWWPASLSRPRIKRLSLTPGS